VWPRCGGGAGRSVWCDVTGGAATLVVEAGEGEGIDAGRWKAPGGGRQRWIGGGCTTTQQVVP
jgi:hypothetical protein